MSARKPRPRGAGAQPRRSRPRPARRRRQTEPRVHLPHRRARAAWPRRRRCRCRGPGPPPGHICRRAEVGEQERKGEQRQCEDGQCSSQCPAAPEPERNRCLRAEQKRAEGMNGKWQQRCCCRGEHLTALWPLERTHEQVGGKRTREREERVHPPERPVHQQQLRRCCERSCDEPRRSAGEPAREVVTDRHRCQREDEREPAQGLRRRVDGQSNMGQQEMQRRSSAIEDDGVQQVAEWPCGDQPGDGLVLVQGLPADVGQEACEEERHQSRERERRRERDVVRSLACRSLAAVLKAANPSGGYPSVCLSSDSLRCASSSDSSPAQTFALRSFSIESTSDARGYGSGQRFRGSVGCPPSSRLIRWSSW